MLESLKEYFSSTVSTATQRIRNPVFGAFSLSWCAFNWKSILYLLFSKTEITDKIAYISDKSNWMTVAVLPCLSVVVLCGLLPWINNFISIWQAKPLDNNDSIENHRKAKRILRDTRLQRLKAKHDVTYDKVKTGAEKDIQGMKEQITQSQARMGELTEEKEALLSQLRELNARHESLQNTADQLKNDADRAIKRFMAKQGEIEELKSLISAKDQLIDRLKSNDQPDLPFS